MLAVLPTPFDWNQISDYFEAINLRNEIAQHKIDIQKLIAHSDINNILEDFEEEISLDHLQTISIKSLHFYEHQKHLILDPDYHFSKYRLITLRSSLYDKLHYFDVQKYRNYCRTKEQEALKSGLNHAIWSMKEGERLFGHSEEAGYFGGKGSSGWKYIALSNYFFDLYCSNNNLFLKRVSPYDTLMKQGKLLHLQQLLGANSDDDHSALLKFLMRKLEINISAYLPETKDS